MMDELLENRATITREDKEKQQDELFNLVLRMLVVEGHRIKQLDGEKDMFDAINRIDLTASFLNIVEGKHDRCVRPGCNYKTHANFFRAKDSGIWLYTCPHCSAGAETITFADLVLELFRSKYKGCNHRTIVRLIRKAFDVNFVSEFYQETQNRLDYNMEMLRGVDEESYLAKLIRKRRLEELLEDYNEIALMYLLEDNKYEYSFYASRQTLLDYFKQIKKQSKSNSIIEKVNLLADLGFITKITGADVPSELRKKVKYRASDEGFLKDVAVYQVKRITEKQLQEAEEYAKAIINNKIYRNKVSIKQTIEEACSFTKDEELFLNRANKAIEEELKTKGYIALSTLTSKIDKKAKYYKKAEKDFLFELLEDRIYIEANVKKIKATETNKKKYNMKRVKDSETILIKSDKEVEVSPRIRVSESVRIAKKKKNAKIVSKKKKAQVKKTMKEPFIFEEELNIVKTWKENGATMALMSDGSTDMIDIPF